MLFRYFTADGVSLLGDVGNNSSQRQLLKVSNNARCGFFYCPIELCVYFLEHALSLLLKEHPFDIPCQNISPNPLLLVLTFFSNPFRDQTK